MTTLWTKKDVKYLVKAYFGVTLTPLQVKIARTVAFDEHPRVVICCMTRYGKSFSVALGILLWIASHPGKRIAIIAPTQEKTSIIRNYLASFVTHSQFFINLLDLDRTGVERIRKEVSHTRMTWKNGVEMRTLSAEGQGQALMGFGADKCVSGTTLLHTDSGVLRIEDIVKNRLKVKILSFDFSVGKTVYETIRSYQTNTNDHNYFVRLNDLYCTSNHPIFVIGKGWIDAEKVRVNDKIYIVDCVNECYDNHKMRDLRKPILQATKPHPKSTPQLLQPQMPRNMAKWTEQLFMERRKDKKILRCLWERICGGFQKKRESEILRQPMQIQRMEDYPPAKSKNRETMPLLSEKISRRTFKYKQELLQPNLREQTTRDENDPRRKPDVERRNTIRPLLDNVRRTTENQHQNTGELRMFSLFEKEEIGNPPCKLQQERRPTRKLSGALHELSHEDEPQPPTMGISVIERIERIPSTERVYNLTIEKTHNFFANGILTHNCIVDETCDVDFAVYRSKITRMLGDNPASTYLEIGNPWHRDNQMWIHWTDPNWLRIHVGYTDALSEGRISQGFLNEQEETLTEREFQVLYKAEFPETAEDALLDWAWLERAHKAPQKPQDKPVILMGADIAEQGNDLTVVSVASWDKETGTYNLLGVESWGKVDLMPTVAKMLPLIEKWKPSFIRIDATGIGSGVYSRLEELHREGRINAIISAFKGGMACSNEKNRQRFLNQKAESYWHLRSLFEADKITILPHRDLINQLSKMKWELTSSEKIRIRDPGTKEGDTAEEKSPDFADSLNITLWGGGTPALVFGNLSTKTEK